jgi:hypothetical protein
MTIGLTHIAAYRLSGHTAAASSVGWPVPSAWHGTALYSGRAGRHQCACGKGACSQAGDHRFGQHGSSAEPSIVLENGGSFTLVNRTRHLLHRPGAGTQVEINASLGRSVIVAAALAAALPCRGCSKRSTGRGRAQIPPSALIFTPLTWGIPGQYMSNDLPAHMRPERSFQGLLARWAADNVSVIKELKPPQPPGFSRICAIPRLSTSLTGWPSARL